MKAMKSEEKKMVDEQKPNFVLDSSRKTLAKLEEQPEKREERPRKSILKNS